LNSRRATISGIGHYAPEKRLTNAELEKLVETSDEWIRTRTGICERRISEGENTSDMAVNAARRALDDAGVDAADLDLIIVATASPDMMFPATACIVQGKLGAYRAGAFDLSTGCAGFTYALSVGAQLVASGGLNHVLVIGADRLSSLLDFTDRNTCVLFGDGAGAVVLEPNTEGYGLLSFALRADGTGAELLKLPAGGSRLPASVETVQARQHFVHMNGNEIFRSAVKSMSDMALEVTQGAGLTIADVDVFLPHQANLRIIEAAARRAGVPFEKVFVNVDRYGNTSCASIALAMSEAMDAGRLQPGNIVTVCAFGAGLSWAGLVLRWSHSRTLARGTDTKVAEPAAVRPPGVPTHVQSYIRAL
jgi:3-oxoacyl-[acyl-carrier-protein] synthase-3